MTLEKVLSKSDQATLFMPDIEGIQKSFNKKVYLIKRIVYDRMHTAVVNCNAPDQTKYHLIKELEGILHMKNSKAEKAPIQEVMTIREFDKSEQSLIDAVVKRCKEDSSFLERLGKYIV
ncbi:MAG: hypothetical protein Q4B28_05280 [bacterium]|nr:hypothetical protein [bacterium]